MNLIYSYAFGAPIYKELCQEMISSARRNGFTGDILILTDTLHEFNGANSCCLENMGKNDLWRTALPRAVNVENYEKILYVDSDVIFTGNPERLMVSDKIAISSIGNFLFTAVVTSHFLTEKEKRDAKENKTIGINSGTVSIPGNMALDLFTKWEARWKSFDLDNAPYVYGRPYPRECWDECALQSLWLRGEIEAELLPFESVLFPAIPINLDRKFTKETVAIHFVGLYSGNDFKAKLLEWMKTAQNPLAIPVLLEKIRVLCPPQKSAEEMVIETLKGMHKEILSLRKRVAELENKEELVLN